MIFIYKVTEGYITNVAIRADDEAQAMRALARIDQEDGPEAQQINGWLLDGFQGRRYELLNRVDENYDFSASKILKEESNDVEAVSEVE